MNRSAKGHPAHKGVSPGWASGRNVFFHALPQRVNVGTKHAKVKTGDAIKIGANRVVFIREIFHGKILVEVEADEHVTIVPRYKQPSRPIDDSNVPKFRAPAAM